MAAMLLIVTLLLSFAHPVAAANGEVEAYVNETVWYLETEVQVRGSGLQGPVPSASKVCFASEAEQENAICFPVGHANISKWTPSLLTFYPPKNVPPIGVLSLMLPTYDSQCSVDYTKEKKCQQTLVKKRYPISSYKAHPYIVAVRDVATGKPAISLLAGKTYGIEGYRFGDSGIGVQVDAKLITVTDVTAWSHDYIEIKASRNYFGDVLRVHNGAGLGNEWKFRDPHPELDNSKQGTSSSAASSKPFVSRLTGSGMVKSGFFSDVSATDAQIDAIDWAVSKGIVQGYANGTFRPDAPVNRAELLKLIFLAYGGDVTPLDVTQKLPFSDVQADAWFAPYVLQASKYGIVTGYKDGTFKPTASVTVAEAIKILYRSLAVPTLDPRGTAWYSRYYEHALLQGIVSDAMKPDEEMSRKHVVWALWSILRFKERFPSIDQAYLVGVGVQGTEAH